MEEPSLLSDVARLRRDLPLGFEDELVLRIYEEAEGIARASVDTDGLRPGRPGTSDSIVC